MGKKIDLTENWGNFLTSNLWIMTDCMQAILTLMSTVCNRNPLLQQFFFFMEKRLSDFFHTELGVGVGGGPQTRMPALFRLDVRCISDVLTSGKSIIWLTCYFFPL